jgi:hypothetical protein
MMGLGSNGCFVTGTSCLNRGHGYDFGTSVGQPMSDSVKLLVYDGMRTYSGYWEEVNIIGRAFEIEL